MQLLYLYSYSIIDLIRLLLPEQTMCGVYLKDIISDSIFYLNLVMVNGLKMEMLLCIYLKLHTLYSN
jgi:hypothetical protein